MENLELEIKFLQSRIKDLQKELNQVKCEKTNIILDKNHEINKLTLINEDLEAELKYNRMAVKYLTDTNKIMLEEIRTLKGKGDK